VWSLLQGNIAIDWLCSIKRSFFFVLCLAHQALRSHSPSLSSFLNLPWRDSIPLQEPEFLGYYYTLLTPEDLGGYTFWQSIPLVPLKGLLNGEEKPNGIIISAAEDGMITYKVKNLRKKLQSQIVFPAI